jgi:hypothetical protein
MRTLPGKGGDAIEHSISASYVLKLKHSILVCFLFRVYYTREDVAASLRAYASSGILIRVPA